MRSPRPPPCLEDPRVEKVCIWTPDKDLAQCVREDRVVQIDRRGKVDQRCGRRTRKIRSAPRADSRLSCAGRRQRRWISRHCRHRGEGRGRSAHALWQDRTLSVAGSRRAAASRAAIQGTGNPPDRCASLYRRQRVGVARTSGRISRHVRAARGARPCGARYESRASTKVSGSKLRVSSDMTSPQFVDGRCYWRIVARVSLRDRYISLEICRQSQRGRPSSRCPMACPLSCRTS